MYRARHEKGLDEAFLKHGRLVLVSPARLFALLESTGRAA
jgi:hypothetical protein